jgi:hypothetical protein
VHPEWQQFGMPSRTGREHDPVDGGSTPMTWVSGLALWSVLFVMTLIAFITWRRAAMNEAGEREPSDDFGRYS